MQAETTPVLTLTPAAGDRMRYFRRMHGDETAAVRITVRPEASVAEKYELEFVPLASAGGDDVRVLDGDLVILLDPRSARLVAGTRVDFQERMWSSGFHFENPNRAELSDALTRRLQRVIDERIGPMVASHGGQVALVEVRDRRAFVRFGGGCQGCGLAPVTLKQGVVAAIRAELPEIVEVVDVTDHAAGENPYVPAAPR